MPQHNTRRAFLKVISSTGFTGLVSSHSTTPTSDSTAEIPTLAASDLLIPDTAIPTIFEQYSNPDLIPLVHPVESIRQQLDSADITAKGYWKGNTRSTPQWAVVSIAMVAKKTLSRAIVEEATTQSYEGPIAKFSTDTGIMTEFEQTYSWSDRQFDWNIDMIGVSLSKDSDTDPALALREQIKIQFFDNIGLVTIIFGPGNASPSVGSLLERYAMIQSAQIPERED